MATTTRNDYIVVHEHNNHNDDNNTGDDTGTKDATVATGAATTGGAAGAPGTTSFNLRVEQNKIPEFFGTKRKDTIWAM
jgi:hypothetical protein